MNVLAFDVAGTPYAIAVEAIAEVAEAPALRPVPLGPAGVLGLAEFRGAVVAVLDLGRLLDEHASGERATRIVRLAAPHDRTALAVSGRLQTCVGAIVPGHVVIDGTPHILLDAAEILRRAAGN